MECNVRERKVTYRYLMLGFLAIATFFSMAVTACEKLDEHQREDYEKAYEWNKYLAEKGDTEAQYNLGLLYEKGMGVPQDDIEAVKWYWKAADQGDALAQHRLGIRYANPQGIPKNDVLAAKWFRKAADQGLPQSQYNLGIMYHYGRGVPQDNVMAYMWYDIAVSRFPASESEYREKAVRSRDAVASKMTPVQIAEAQRLARDWKPEEEGKKIEEERVAIY